MTNKISDERLRELVEKCNSSDWQAPKERCSYGLYINELEQMATELLSARQTIVEKDKLIERLVKYTDHYSGCPSEASNYSDDCTCGYTALMKEIGDTDGKD